MPEARGTATPFGEALDRALAGGPEKYRERLPDQGKVAGAGARRAAGRS